jgi:hypothetical protein
MLQPGCMVFNITIYSQEYTYTNGMLVINTVRHQGVIDTGRAMWTISYHGNNHYNSIRLPGNPSIPMVHIKNVQQFESYLQQALDEYQDDLIIISTMSRSEGQLIPTITIEPLHEAAGQMISYIALQILNAGGAAIPESHLKSLLSQVEETVVQSLQEANAPPQVAHQDTPLNKNPALALCVAELKATLARYRDSIFQLLQSSPISTPLPDLTAHYDQLRRHYHPIILSHASLITHLGGNTISEEDINQFTQQAETDALVLHTTPTPDTPAPPLLHATVNNDATKVDPTQAMQQDAMIPPNKPKPSLKAGEFLPAHSTMPPFRQAEANTIDPGDKDDDEDPGIYNHTVEGVGDGTHLIIASFIKTNDKI